MKRQQNNHTVNPLYFPDSSAFAIVVKLSYLAQIKVVPGRN